MEVLEMPYRISKSVLDRGLDANTTFEIVSIDIADVDVGENIGPRLQADRADADMRMAQEVTRCLAKLFFKDSDAVSVGLDVPREKKWQSTDIESSRCTSSTTKPPVR
jgi:hypothetical protein